MKKSKKALLVPGHQICVPYRINLSKSHGLLDVVGFNKKVYNHRTYKILEQYIGVSCQTGGFILLEGSTVEMVKMLDEEDKALLSVINDIAIDNFLPSGTILSISLQFLERWMQVTERNTEKENNHKAIINDLYGNDGVAFIDYANI